MRAASLFSVSVSVSARHSSRLRTDRQAAWKNSQPTSCGAVIANSFPDRDASTVYSLPPPFRHRTENKSSRPGNSRINVQNESCSTLAVIKVFVSRFRVFMFFLRGSTMFFRGCLSRFLSCFVPFAAKTQLFKCEKCCAWIKKERDGNNNNNGKFVRFVLYLLSPRAAQLQQQASAEQPVHSARVLVVRCVSATFAEILFEGTDGSSDKVVTCEM